MCVFVCMSVFSSSHTQNSSLCSELPLPRGRGGGSFRVATAGGLFECLGGGLLGERDGALHICSSRAHVPRWKSDQPNRKRARRILNLASKNTHCPGARSSGFLKRCQEVGLEKPWRSLLMTRIGRRDPLARARQPHWPHGMGRKERGGT